MEELKEEVLHQSQMIIYGVKVPHSRENYLRTYGCARWTRGALAKIAKLSPVVEIGAGEGHWRRELVKLGADVVSFDSGAALPLQGSNANGNGVLQGDEEMLSRPSSELQHPGTCTPARHLRSRLEQKFPTHIAKAAPPTLSYPRPS